MGPRGRYKKIKYPLGFFAKNPKTCALCERQFFVNSSRQFDKQKYCSTTCVGRVQVGRTFKRTTSFKDARKCEQCGIDYIATQITARFCSRKCHDVKHHRKHRSKHNSLQFHIKNLLKVSAFDRRQLSADFLLAMHEKQGGLCALTGLKMTWITGAGRVPTNVSIDRISSVIGYELDNVQLVCTMANIMKGKMPQSEFIDICKRIVLKAATP